MASMTLKNINPNILKVEYAVQGPLVARAGEIEEELKRVNNLNFLQRRNYKLSYKLPNQTIVLCNNIKQKHHCRELFILYFVK